MSVSEEIIGEIVSLLSLILRETARRNFPARHFEIDGFTRVYERVSDYRVSEEERESGRARDGRREGYAGRGRVMHIDGGLHEFFILSYDFESRSLARKSISPLLVVSAAHNTEWKRSMCNARSFHSGLKSS